MRRVYASDFQSWIENKKIAVVGAGISNRPLVRWLYRYNRDISVFDQMEKGNKRMKTIMSDFEAEGIHLAWVAGESYLDRLTGFDLVFRTPIMRPDHPALLRVGEEGAIITSEMSLFLALCPAHTTGITGSNGKTTTTTLISELYKSAGRKVWTGGNIGTPLLNKVFEMEEDDEVVVELSSFQLFDLVARLDTAVVTNILPNHLDIHEDFDEYIAAKKNIFKEQRPYDRLVLNYSDSISRSFALEARGEIVWFNRKDSRRSKSLFLEGDKIWFRNGSGDTVALVEKEDIVLPGRFNIDNYMAAWGAVAGRIEPLNLRKVASSFKGVPHRMELVREHEGIRWYNSSIDSTPERTITTLETLFLQGRPIVLICGGRDKNLDYSELGPVILDTVTKIVFCGENTPLIRSSVAAAELKRKIKVESIPMHEATSYEEAVRLAAKIAQPGDSVLLSPTGTSFDRFFNFEERGETFRQLVLEL
ncbi:MAG TPA: UDP-N-acetylmuramoyl-L-alanine--D-glutamate ligase [Clostridiaceae bacterium]|nr:UDP-N-acetylmuramoyl-L-alanine--D-glutamate ligase [Clostridiaceae bacterium]